MKEIITICLLFLISDLFSSPGDTIDTFTLEGQPGEGMRGLSYDPVDGNIWCAGTNSNDDCYFCKFKNIPPHDIIQNWQKLQGHHIAYDIAYPYQYNNSDTIVVIDTPYPRLKIYNKYNGQYLGGISQDPFGGNSVGVESNRYENTLYASGASSSYIIKKWNGSSWDNWATSGYYPLGIAFGWNHVFVIHNDPTNYIWVFNLDGTKYEEIKLNKWNSTYMYGLSKGRDNVVNNNETLYTTCLYPSMVIKEIEIGDYNTVINTTSIGDIKAIFH
ncbi:MAG: hypothetical protein ACUVWP_07350, partial [bacterium]